MIKDENYLTNVREQYEGHPYPPRNPEEEKERIAAGMSAALDVINFYCFEGKESFDDDFQILVAGGGTGDSVIYLAEQLRGKNAHITYVDISTASMAVAQERAKVRDLENITWIHDSLLNIPDLNIGPFDYIDCIGVLHHLEDPDAGLAALASVLKPEGAMSIMLYAPYGRTGVYHMQELMRMINDDTDDINEQLSRTKTLIDDLPASNSFKKYESLIIDHKIYGDEGIYDLLLHTQDRAYSIPELYEFIGKQDLHLSHFITSYGLGKYSYKPSTYISNPDLKTTISQLPVQDQQAIAELTIGNIFKHITLLTKSEATYPSLDDLDMTPFFSTSFSFDGIYEQFYQYILSNNDSYVQFTQNSSKLKVTFKRTRLLPYVFKYLDGKRSAREIIALIQKDEDFTDQPPTVNEIIEGISDIYEGFHRYDWMLLRKSSIPEFKILGQLQEYVINKYQLSTNVA